MKSWLRLSSQIALCSVLATVSAPATGRAQSSKQLVPAPAAQQPASLVRVVRVVVDKDSPAVEIISNHPITPSIQKLDNPSRLVIDLPNATLIQRRKRLDFRSDQISAVRVDQYQTAPAIVRVVVDLLAPTAYTWDAAGNRLMVRLRPDESARKASEPPTVPALTSGVQPAVVPVSPGTSGAVVLAGSRLQPGRP